jgi:MFS family permease
MYISVRDRPSSARSKAGGARVPSVVVLLGVVSLVTDISSESVNAVLPLYLTAALGLSTLAYGFVDGLMQGASALVRVAGGWAADRGDRPKWVAFAGYALSALTRGALLLASGFGAVTALVAVDRIGKGIRTAPRDAMISAASDADQLGRSFGVHRTLDTVGAALGPLFAFVILWAIPNGYATVFVMSLGFAVIGVAALGLLVPDRRPRAEATTAGAGEVGVGPRPFSWRHLADRRLRRLLLVAGVLGLLTIGDGFLYLSLQKRDGFAAQWFPLLYVGTNLAYLALAVPIGRLADRVGRARVLVLGHLALLAAYAFAAVSAGSAATTVATLVLLGVFYAATDGVLAAVAGRLVDPSARASAIGTAQTVVAVARMIASAGFGLLWFTLGRASAMLAVAAVLAIAIPVCLLAVRTLAGSERARTTPGGLG